MAMAVQELASLASLPAELLLQLVASLDLFDLASLTCAAAPLRDVLRPHRLAMRRAHFSSCVSYMDFGSSAARCATELRRLHALASMTSYEMMPNLRLMHVGSSLLLVEYVRHAVRRDHSVNVGPMFQEGIKLGKTDSDLLTCCYLLASWIVAGGRSCKRVILDEDRSFAMWPLDKSISLNLNSVELRDDGCMLFAMLLLLSGKRCDVTGLYLDGCEIFDVGALGLGVALANGAAPNLRALQLENNGLTSLGLSWLLLDESGAFAKQLLWLDLKDNGLIRCDGAAVLADFIRRGCLKKLNVLRLSGCGIGDAGGEELAKALGEPSSPCACLRQLFLEQNRFGNDTLIALAAALRNRHLPLLKLLDLGQQVYSDAPYRDEGVCAIAETFATAYDSSGFPEALRIRLHSYRLTDRAFDAITASIVQAMEQDPSGMGQPPLRRLVIDGVQVDDQQDIAVTYQARVSPGACRRLRAMETDQLSIGLWLRGLSGSSGPTWWRSDSQAHSDSDMMVLS